MFSGFENDFQALLESLTVRPTKDSDQQPISFRARGSKIISAKIKELRDSSVHLYFPFQAKELHDLRILAKRLRYAVEIFGDCWQTNAEKIAKEIASLQTSLGELHDCDLWLDSLGKRLKRPGRLRADEQTTSLAAGAEWLVAHFISERTEHYRAALARWERWEEKGFLEKLEANING